MVRRLSVIGLATGLLLVLAAGLMRWVLAPALAVLPASTDTTRIYTGTASTLLNPAGLSPDKPLILHGVPIRIDHQTQVLSTQGGSAHVLDTRKVTANGAIAALVAYSYGVDRSTLGAGALRYPGSVHQTGLTFNWPIRTAAHNYTGWVSDTHRTTVLRYTGTAIRGGVETYVFTTRTSPEPVTDSQVLAGLPTSLPKVAMPFLVTGLHLPAARADAITRALPSLPDPVPLSYDYRVDATYWVAPNSGIVVDLVQHEVRTVAIRDGTTSLPVSQVSNWTFTSPPATLAAAASDAKSNGNQVQAVFVTLPLGLLVLGGTLTVLGLAGLLLGRRRGRHLPYPGGGQQPAPQPEPSELAGV